MTSGKTCTVDSSVYMLPVIDERRTRLSIQIFERTRELMTERDREHVRGRLYYACRRFNIPVPKLLEPQPPDLFTVWWNSTNNENFFSVSGRINGVKTLKQIACEAFAAGHQSKNEDVLRSKLLFELTTVVRIMCSNDSGGALNAVREDYPALAMLFDGLRARLTERLRWIPIKAQLPPSSDGRSRPIEMTGPSGYVAPNDRAIFVGYYCSSYADPWRTYANDGLGDYGITPTHWRYLTPGPEAAV